MKNKKLILIFTTAIFILGLVTGCGEKDAADNYENSHVADSKDLKEESNTIEEDIELSDWNGEWNSISLYLDEEEIKEAYQELADRHSISVEEAKKEYEDEVKTDFVSIKVQDDEISFYNELDGEPVEKSKYTYIKAHKGEHGGREFYWYEFQAEDDIKHKNILLMDIHGEETMPHFHMRYGDNIEELVKLLGWNPTLLSPTSTIDQIYEEVAE